MDASQSLEAGGAGKVMAWRRIDTAEAKMNWSCFPCLRENLREDFEKMDGSKFLELRSRGGGGRRSKFLSQGISPGRFQ
ncbi:MAG TPA: hypothetical protein VHX61_05525 [Rhizomicrobium sp.]|jgi:hypothetical protein|nr:hypothetical protein [Rhizomicrobium sp.]